jgi:hypothetical protein
MRVGLPICVLAKEVVEIASLAFGVVARRHPAVATRHVRKDNGVPALKTSFLHLSFS